MLAITKLVGVPADAIGRIHEILNGPEMRTRDAYHHTGKEDTQYATQLGKFPYAKLMDSKLDTEKGTYTVTIRFNLCLTAYQPNDNTDNPEHPVTQIFPPASALEEIYQAIDPRFLPETETVVRPETIPPNPTEELVEELGHRILGEKTQFDIVHEDTGEVLVPAYRKITKTLVRVLINNIEKLDFENGPDPIIKMVKELRDKMAKAK